MRTKRLIGAPRARASTLTRTSKQRYIVRPCLILPGAYYSSANPHWPDPARLVSCPDHTHKGAGLWGFRFQSDFEECGRKTHYRQRKTEVLSAPLLKGKKGLLKGLVFVGVNARLNVLAADYDPCGATPSRGRRRPALERLVPCCRNSLKTNQIAGFCNVT